MRYKKLSFRYLFFSLSLIVLFSEGFISNSTGIDKKLYKDFMQKYSGYNPEVEDIASRELERFSSHTYADNAGAGLYQKSQITEIHDDLIRNAYGNVHSRNPSARLTDKRLNEARDLIYKFFNIDKSIYSIIFTSGATSGLKLVGENFPWTLESKYFYLRINHNSVLGIREYATNNGVDFRALSYDEIEKILKKQKETKGNKRFQNFCNDNMCENLDYINRQSMNSKSHKTYCLFAFPAKDNFVGQKYPLVWIKDIQEYGLSDDCVWRVLLDAAAFAPTEPLDITEYPADFVVISFYKMFGYPTGLGVLIIRNNDAQLFNKVYFGGGAVIMASCDSRWCKMKETPSMKFEDGTVSFLNIASLKYGFKRLEYFGMKNISNHIAALSMYVYEELSSLTHFSGKPVVIFYGRKDLPPNGGIVNFNILRPDGSIVNFGQVEHMASENHIHLRTGCFCNPGGCQDFLNLSLEEIQLASEIRDSCSDLGQLNNKPLGSVRISFGYLSTYKDAKNVVNFIKKYFVL
ncbi:class V family protein [Cryptosporidium andersoni]|uniref:Class V family protein n=1 Tax=Cryptosporidium andersoni TaxID=117008 RepID=A0A1J4MSS2_9CRYT|nr:class V family protein [Cryptosporidium andersoni]